MGLPRSRQKKITIAPRRQNMVINDQLEPGVEFTQDTKSGSSWVLFWIPNDDRLYRWLDGQWKPLKPGIISDRKKDALRSI